MTTLMIDVVQTKTSLKIDIRAAVKHNKFFITFVNTCYMFWPY